MEQLVEFNIAEIAKKKGFNYSTIYAWYHTPKHRIKYEKFGEICLRTNGNPFGDYFEGQNWNQYKKHTKIICSAPTQSLLQKWLREIHNIEVDVMRYTYSGGEYQGKCYMWVIDKYDSNYNPETEDPWILETRQSQGYDFKVYEEALEFGLQEGLKLIK